MYILQCTNMYMLSSILANPHSLLLLCVCTQLTSKSLDSHVKGLVSDALCGGLVEDRVVTLAQDL